MLRKNLYLQTYLDMDAPALPCKAGNFDDVVFCHYVLFQVHSFWGVDYAPVLKLEFYLYYGFCFSFVCLFSFWSEIQLNGRALEHCSGVNPLAPEGKKVYYWISFF